MFEQFLLQGSIFSVALMVYACNVMLEAARLNKIDPRGILYAPKIIVHPLSGLIMFAAIPCILWPAIYIGLYDGWIAGIVAWFILQVIGVIMYFILGIRYSELIGIHFILACIAFPIGYYLSVSSF